MRQRYKVQQDTNSTPITVEADEAIEDPSSGILTLRLEGKDVARFQQYVAWWVEQKSTDFDSPF